MFPNIPLELKVLPQWVCWRYEESEGKKRTKILYNPHTARYASTTKRGTWTTFENAVAASHLYSGIGFVFTEEDDYAGIDLDHVLDREDGERLFEQHKKIFAAFNSYSEVSPSGLGLHIIVKGSVPAGRKRNGVEIYDRERYFTFTGNVYNDAPIEDRQELLTQLWTEMGQGQTTSAFHGDSPEREDDRAVLDKALAAVNGEKFKALHEARWQDYYSSQSEADFAYVDIIAFYTQNRMQITRVFQASGLGQRDKAMRGDYVNRMINRSFDRMLPPIDFDTVSNNINVAIAELNAPQPYTPPPPPPVAPQPVSTSEDVSPVPPGLLGEIAKFIYAASPRPVPEIALAGALGLMAGICGRAYNVSAAGLNQYVLLLAPTGTGKEGISSGLSRLMEQIKATVPASSEFIGPAEIRSDVALLKHLHRNSKSFVSLVGEFGLKMRQLSSHNANPNDVGLKRVFLDLFNKSGANNVVQPTIYADKDKNTEAVKAPAFSLLGESTPESFYQTLDEGMISDGLLPRFTIVEYHGKRPKRNRHHSTAVPPIELVAALSGLAADCLALNSRDAVVDVKLDPAAERFADDWDDYCDNHINGSSNDVTRQLWNRGHIKMLKLAALIAVGIDHKNPVILLEHVEWAKSLIMRDILNLLTKWEKGTIGKDSEESKQSDAISSVIRDYLLKEWEELAKYKTDKVLWTERIIPYSYISRRISAMAAFRHDRVGPTNALKRTLSGMIDSGTIREIGKNELIAKYGTGQRAFVLVDVEILRG